MKEKNLIHVLWLNGMRAYLRMALFFYYKKITINYNEPLQPNQPTLFLGNHQSGLMDPLLVATRKGSLSYFLTRAAVFKKPWVARFLKSLMMLPVYRIRDGWNNLSKNGEIFKTCSQLLYEKNAIVIFPEGSHDLKRRIRPLSKGFSRIIVETLQHHPNLEIQLVPVGFNYKHAEVFGDSVVINFGTSLSTKAYQITDDNASVSILKNDVREALTKLTTHIESEDYDATLHKLEKLNVDFLNPETVNQCLATHFKDCVTQPKQKKNIVKLLAKVVLCISLFMPYGIWKLILEPKIKEREFTATFRFGLVITLIPIFMLVTALILGLNFGWLYAIVYLTSVFVLDLLAVKL